MPAVGGSGGYHRKHKRGGGGKKVVKQISSSSGAHRPYGGGHTAPSGNVGISHQRKHHQQVIAHAAGQATHTKKFKHAASHPAKSSYAKQYAKSIAKQERKQARQSQRAITRTGSGVGRTLIAKTPHIKTGLGKSAEAQSHKALQSTRPDLSAANVVHTLSSASQALLPHTGESSNPLQSGVGVNPIEGLQHPTQGRSPKQIAEDAAATALIVAGPEATGAGVRLLARGVSKLGKVDKAVQEGTKAERVAKDVTEAVPSHKPEMKAPNLKKPEKPSVKVRALNKTKSVAKKAKAAPRGKLEKTAAKPVVSAARGQKTRVGLGAFAAAPASHGGPGGRVSALVKGHEQAVIHHPLETAATTARVAEGIPGALVSIPAAAYTSVKHGTTKPLEGLVQQQKDYLGQVGHLFSGNPKQVERTVANKVGLVPAISAALGGSATLDTAKKLAGKAKPTIADAAELAKADSKTKRLVKTVNDESKPLRVRQQARRQLEAEVQDKRVRTAGKRHADRQREAERAGVREQRAIAHSHREHQVLDKPLSKVARHKVGDITELDLVNFLGRHGFTRHTSNLLNEIRMAGEDLRKPTRDIPAHEVDTRRVINTILAHPDVLAHDRIWNAVDALRKVQHARSIESHDILTGKHETTPNPKQERARTLQQMRQQGVLAGGERIPPELTGKTSVKPESGVDSERAIREQATKEAKQAKAIRRKARVEQARRKGIARELNVRRTADERRSIIRARTRKERNIEKRITAWTEKAKKAKKPETRKRYEAKVKQLENQLRDTRATIAMAASPARLRVVKRLTENRQKVDALTGQATGLEARAAEQLSVVDRFKQAEKLRIDAHKVEAGQMEGDAAAMRAEANRLEQQGLHSQEIRGQAAQSELQNIRQQKGLGEPVYFKGRDLSRESGAMMTSRLRPPKKDKFNKGILQAQGRIDESGQTILNDLEVGRRRLAQDRTYIEALNENSVRIGDRRIFTSGEKQALRKEGKIPAGYTAVPIKEFAGAIQRNDAWRNEVMDARRFAKTKPTGERDLYAIWKKDRWEEFQKQQQPLGGAGPAIRSVFRVQTGLMLGTSPTWFLFQIPATPLGILARNWSPARYARSARAMVDTYKNLSKRERREFEAHIGGNSGNITTVGNITTDLPGEKLREMVGAYDVVSKTPVGRFVSKVIGNLKQGGPLIRMNRAYEAKVRMFAAHMEIDRKAGLTASGHQTLSSHAVNFIDRSGKTANSVYELQQKMLGMRPHQRIAYLNSIEGAKDMRLIEKGINDSLGEWVSLTAAERRASSVVVFYPFVRYSLRWLFYAYPKNNPLKAAVLLNLAQSNDVQLQNILGGKPDLMQSFGDIVTYDAQGNPHTAINMSRSSPGGNSVIEAIGEGKVDLATIMKPVQPMAGNAFLALEHKDAFGNQIHGESTGQIFGDSLFTLSPLTRSGGPLQGINPFVKSKSDISKLFQAIQQKPNPLVPQTTLDLRRQRDTVKLQKLLTRAYAKPKGLSKGNIPSFFPKGQHKHGYALIRRSRRAWTEIDRMMREYGVQTQAEQNANAKANAAQYSDFSKQHGIFGTERGKKKSGGGGGGLFGSSGGGSLFGKSTKKKGGLFAGSSSKGGLFK